MMPSLTNLRKRASASFDTYTSVAATGSPPSTPPSTTRAQRALSRLSKLKIPLRPSSPRLSLSAHSQVQANPSLPFRPSSPISPSHSPIADRPRKLRRQSRASSISTLLAISSTSSSPSPKTSVSDYQCLGGQGVKEKHHRIVVKKTISYPILRSTTSPFDEPSDWWGLREATRRYEDTLSSASGGSGGGRRKRDTRNSLPLSPSSAVSKKSDSPVLPYTTPTTPQTKELTLDLTLDMDLPLASTFSPAPLPSSLPSTSPWSEGYSAGSPFPGVTSRFSLSSYSTSTPPTPSDPVEGAWTHSTALSDESEDSDVDLDSEDYHGCLPLPPRSYLYKYPSQPLVCSTPLTLTSPTRSTLQPPSSFGGWSNWSMMCESQAVEEGKGFVFAPTPPVAQVQVKPSYHVAPPSPPATPRLSGEQLVDGEEPSSLELPEQATEGDGEGKASQLSMFLEELASEGGDGSPARPHSGSIYRSSIPFPLFEAPPSPSPLPPPFARPGTPAPAQFFPPARALSNASQCSAALPHTPFVLDSPPPARRRLRRVTGTIAPPSPPSPSCSDLLDTPSKPSRVLPTRLELGGAARNGPSPVSSATTTPTPATPRGGMLYFPRFDDEVELVPVPAPTAELFGPLNISLSGNEVSPEQGKEKKRRRLGFVPGPVNRSRPEVEQEQEQEGWMLLASGEGGGRRRSF